MTGRLLQMSGVVIDLVHHVDHVPRAGEEVETPGLMVTAGGGFNAMVAAKRLGAAVAYGGAIGTGIFADIVSRMLAAEGFEVLTSSRPPVDQGTCVVLVDRDGERSFVSNHGAERCLDAAELSRIAIKDYDWILLTGYGLFKSESAEVLGPWLESLPRGPRLLFDPGPVVDLIPGGYLNIAMSRADWISVNRKEASVLTGTNDPALAVQKLAAGRQGAIVRSGEDGCRLSLSGMPMQHVTGFGVDTIDTNGAGDTHDGAFIAACGRGFDPLDAAMFANAAAALSTTRQGPATAPDFQETQAFLEAQGMCLSPPGHGSSEKARLGVTGR